MLYELSADGYTVGVFPTEAAARHNAAYMPGGCYTIREWTRDGDFFDVRPLNPVSYTHLTLPTN